MDNQIILACDDQGNFEEYIPKMVGHTGYGRRHLAITVLLYNAKGQVLLQKRKHRIFDNLWDFTASTHPLYQKNAKESFEDATKRALKDEYDIEDISLKNIGTFNYFAPYRTARGDFCENEHCALMVGEYNGEFKLNPQVGYQAVWVQKNKFLDDLAKNPQNYAPWAIEGVKLLNR